MFPIRLPARLAVNIAAARAYSHAFAIGLDLGHPVTPHILNLAR